MLATITSAVTSASWVQILGMLLFSIGVVGTLFSPYRYLLVYLAAGMCYWLGIEVVSYVFKAGFNFSEANAYISSVGLSMVAIFAWVAATEPKRQRKRAEIREANYIEHTPLYDGEVPTSKG